MFGPVAGQNRRSPAVNECTAEGGEKKKVGNPNGDPVRGRDAPINAMDEWSFLKLLPCNNQLTHMKFVYN